VVSAFGRIAVDRTKERQGKGEGAGCALAREYF